MRGESDTSSRDPHPLQGACLGIRSWGDSYLGRRRQNEDAFGWREPEDLHLRKSHGCLYVIADGMGGHAAGEVASRLAVETVLQGYYAAAGAAPEKLDQAIRAANRQIWHRAQQELELEGMGCTVVAGAFLGDQVIVAHVGDSRGYRARGGYLELLTQDHLYVTENLCLSGAEAQGHPLRHVLSRALGASPEVEPEIQSFGRQKGDRYLFCSDGLSNTLSEAELLEGMSRETPQESIASLLRLAKKYGADDNTTAVAVYINT